jgi:hypothetical protein
MTTYQPNLQDFDDQGHRPDQREGAYKIATICVVGFFVMLIIIIATSCEKVEPDQHTLIVEQGCNIFKPNYLPYYLTKNNFEYEVEIGSEWWEGNLTDPAGYGCKLYCIGKANYHNGGCNFALSYSDGKVYLTSRYYEPIESGTYKLHEGLSKYEMQPNIPVICRVTWSDSTRFYVNDSIVATVMDLPHNWILPPFLGRSGDDNNYPGGPLPGAFATRDLELKIRML